MKQKVITWTGNLFKAYVVQTDTAAVRRRFNDESLDIKHQVNGIRGQQAAMFFAEV